MTDAIDTTLEPEVAPTSEALARALDECMAGDRAFTLELAAQIRDALRQTAPAPASAPISMIYRNWRGEIAPRVIIPSHLYWGATDWHPEQGWLMAAHDVEKDAPRDFALADCQFADLTGDEVRPLNWRKYPTVDKFHAETGIGFYVYTPRGETVTWAFVGRAEDGRNAILESVASSEDAARAAAQRDFETRIRAYFVQTAPIAHQNGGAA